MLQRSHHFPLPSLSNSYHTATSNCSPSDVIETDFALHPALFFFTAVGWSMSLAPPSLSFALPPSLSRSHSLSSSHRLVLFECCRTTAASETLYQSIHNRVHTRGYRVEVRSRYTKFDKFKSDKGGGCECLMWLVSWSRWTKGGWDYIFWLP